MSADLRIPAAMLTQIVQTVETTMRLTAAIWRSPAAVDDKTGDVQDTGRTCRASIFVPTREPHLTLLADLGAGRASCLAFVQLGTDVQASDELRVGSTVYQVQGTSQPPDMVICALWQLPATDATDDSVGHVLLDDAGQPLLSE